MSRLLKKFDDNAPIFHPWKIDLGKGLFTVVDKTDYLTLTKFRWFAQKSSHCVYAVRKKIIEGKEIKVRMHRQLMNAPAGLDVHHKNKDCLDNRRANLECLTPKLHKFKHSDII